jgi:signal transduction histidine kinase/ActR/RegA family two-component response regulator
MTEAGGPAPSRRRLINDRLGRFLGRRVVTMAVLLFLLAVTVISTFTVRNVIRDQERRLLKERTNEVISVLATTSASVRTTLASSGIAAVDGTRSDALFKLSAAPLTQGGGTIAVAEQRSGQFTVLAAQGAAAQVGAPAGVPAALLARALAAKDFVAEVTSHGSRQLLLVALKVPASTPTVAYLETPLHPTQQQPVRSDSPYRELNVAVYAGRTQDPATLLLVSGAVPHGDERVVKTFPVGSQSWLTVTEARQPLVGSFAAKFPWAVLIGGIVASLLISTLTYTLSRRRAYALDLVEQRTQKLREAQAEAETANRAKSEFISRMSHELRTPLNAVLGFSQVLELYEDLTPEQHRAVTHITNGGKHLLDLINEILDISQVESGRLSLSPEAVLVGDLVHETTELLDPVAAARSVQLITPEVHRCVKYVFADRQRVKQVLLNVIGNGIKYNRQGGSVTITCREYTPGRLRIDVTDTGPGIAASQLPLLFTPFERLGAERTTVEGTGMGLALSRRLAEAMGGTVGVDSVLGQGSTFWIELPIVEGPVDRYHRLERPFAESAAAEDRRPGTAIVHIEDNLSNVNLIEQVLSQRPGVELLAAMQGRLGLDLAREHRPMLILLDLNLPDMDGEDVLRRLRDDPRTSRIPVVIVSADASQRQVQRLLSTGASAYLTKPIDVHQLLKHVDAAAAAAHGRSDAGARQPT